MTDLQTIEQLTDLECRYLAEYEQTIETGLRTFYAVGAALIAIREQRLYRDTHGTFEEYCQQRWGMTSRHARRLIIASEVVGSLHDESGPIGPLPTNEAQARPLASLPPEQRREVWQQVVEHTDKPTAKDVQEAVKRHTWEMSAHERGQGDVDPWEGWEMIDPGDGTVAAWHPAYGEVHAPDIKALQSLQRDAWLRWEFANAPTRAEIRAREEQQPTEPDPMPDDLRTELSRLGWELRDCRISQTGLHLYTLYSEGGRGPGEERGIEGWQVMLEQLLQEEQRKITLKVRQLITQGDRDIARQMVQRITNDDHRLALRWEIDAAERNEKYQSLIARQNAPEPDTPAQRMQKIEDAFPRGSAVIWSKADGTEHLMDVIGASFGGERIEIRPHGTLDMSHAVYVPPAKIRLATDADQDRFEAAKQYRETLLTATRSFLHDMTTKQRDLLCHLLGCYRPDVAEKLVDKLADNRGFLRIIGIEECNA